MGRVLFILWFGFLINLNAQNLSQIQKLFEECVGKEMQNSCQKLISLGVLPNEKECTYKICGIAGLVYTYAQDYQRALNYFEKGCELKDSSACWYFGALHYDGSIKEDYKKAYVYLKKACDLGYGLGCNDIGAMYEKGEGLKQDYHQAKKYYEKACELKEGLGCQNLGVLYGQGKGVKDVLNMYAYISKACKLGVEMSCNAMNRFYADVSNSQEQACENGDIDSCANVGILYSQKDKNKALKYFKKACDSGSSASCFNLATTYKSINNQKEAKRYYEIACKAGESQACCELGQKERCGKVIREIKAK